MSAPRQSLTRQIIEAYEPFGFKFRASGDLDGSGKWTLQQEGDWVHVELVWTVEIQKLVVKQLSYGLKPLLIRNHRWAMECGERGLQNEVRRRSAT